MAVQESEDGIVAACDLRRFGVSTMEALSKVASIPSRLGYLLNMDLWELKSRKKQWAYRPGAHFSNESNFCQSNVQEVAYSFHLTIGI